MKMSILSIATAMLLTVTACTDASIDDAQKPADSDAQPTPTGNVATIYTTTSDGSRLL